ncbi:MAG: Sjogren's syndrome/scleroderma autoantigen 1 family protein [Candidatus Caldarchaeales archaeon]
MVEKSGEDYMKRMADALRSGAKMLSETCPICGSPIFEIKGELWCLKCNKRVVKVRSDEEVATAISVYGLKNTVNVLAIKIEELTTLLSRAVDVDEIRKISEALDTILKTLEQTLKVQNLLRHEG